LLLRSLFVISISLINCPQNQQQSEKILVKAYGNQLTIKNVDHLLDDNMVSSDSTIVLQRAIDNWLMDQILYNESKNKVQNKEELEALVDDYRQSIYIHELQKLTLNEGLDQTIQDVEVDNYIETNSGDYILEDRIARVMLAKLPINYATDQLESIWATEDISGLQALIRESRGLGYTNVTEWHTVNHIKELLPQALIERVNFGGTSSYKEKTDTEIVLLKILEDHKVGEPAPKAYIKDRVKQELFLNRKKEFLNRWKKELYQNNIQSKDIHIYDN